MSKFEGQVDVRSSGELIEKLYNVSLRGNKNIKPYKNALITIEELHPNILAPTQRYVLKSEIKKIEQLRWAILEEYGQDILRLNGFLKVFYEDDSIKHDGPERYGKTIDILPPVIEEYVDFCGYIHYIINDGQHRVYLAHKMQMPVRVALVRGVNKNYPYYAWRLPNGWADVEMREDIPEGYVKKFHVTKDHKFLFRNFNSAFSNVGDSRPYGVTNDQYSSRGLPLV